MKQVALLRVMCSIFFLLLIMFSSHYFCKQSPTPVSLSIEQPTNESATTDTIQQSEDIHEQPLQDIEILTEDNEAPQEINQPIYDLLSVEERITNDLPIELPAVVPYYGEKIVYLTFDDGPNPDITPKILDILSSYNIKATFFVIGNQVEKHPNLLQRIFHEGHAIGNHSYNHIYRELYQNPELYINQLNSTDYIIKSVIGVRPLISRAPGGAAGSFTKSFWNGLERQGHKDVSWNISSGDASNASANKILATIIYQMDNKYLWGHSIVLMHDGGGHIETVKALPQIIELYKQNGFEFHVVNLFTPQPGNYI